MDNYERTIAILIEYDGTSYSGFQYQTNAMTIQQALEHALQKITGHPTRIRGAGRTDAGVHARGQVAAFTTASRHDSETFLNALNHYLPDDIAVRAACEAPAGFHPRHDARARRYRYLIANRRTRPALGRTRALWVREPLDVTAMHAEAQALVGTHDFGSFSAPYQRSTMREVKRACVTGTGCDIAFDIEATAFLPQQVRRTVGVLLAVGKGSEKPGSIQALLNAPFLGAADHAAPPQGLYLMSVQYPKGTLSFEHL